MGKPTTRGLMIKYERVFGSGKVTCQRCLIALSELRARFFMSKFNKYQSQPPVYKSINTTRKCDYCFNEIYNQLDHINCKKDGERTTHQVKAFGNTVQSEMTDGIKNF